MNPYYNGIRYIGAGGSDPLYYPRVQSFDLRTEIHDLLFGNFENPGIGRPLLIRRLKDQKCACWRPKEVSFDPNCKYCQGEGFMWTETLETGYIGRNFGSVLNPSAVISQQNKLTSQGYDDENRAVAYFEWNVFPNYERYTIPTHPTMDRLYELKVDQDGQITRPVVRVAKWQIRSVTPHQGDNGAVQYFEVGLDSDSA